MTIPMRTRSLADPLSLVAFFVALSGLAAHSASASEIHVRDFNDSAASGTTCTLRQAVRSANTNAAIGACEAGQNTGTDQIHVPPGTHIVNLTAGANEDAALTGDLDLTQNVDILGVSTSMSTIDATAGTEIDRLFDVRPGVTVTMQQLTLRGGNATDATGRGGVIRLNATGTLTLDEVDLSLGTAKTGGGVYSSGVLTILDSRIADNHTVVQGAVGNDGGGVAHDATGGNLTIADSEISGNTAEESGAGLWVAGGPLSLQRSLVSDNIGGGNGGGLFVSSNSYLVTYTEFAGNHANAGGGIYLQNMGEVQRCALVFNTATTTGGGLHDAFGGFLRFSTLSGNQAATGGGVYANSGMTLLDSDTIASNGPSGGVHNAAGAFFENTIMSDNAGGNCTGSAPNFGAFNMERTNSCHFVSSVGAPNFPNTNPKLGVLLDNGPTHTIPLLPGSPAINAVSSLIRTNCQNMLDQRGWPRGRPRTNNGIDDVFLCDIGAFEVAEPFRVNTLADAVDANLNDDKCLTAGGFCTLRAAIQQANALPGTYRIFLPLGTYVLSIPGTGENASATGDLDIDPPLEILGAGVHATTVSGGGLDRVFDIASPTHVATDIDATSIRDLTITGGDAGSENGGGILLRDFPLELRGVRLTGNDAPRGSAISSSTGSFFGAGDRPVRMRGSVVEGNTGGMALFLHEALLLHSGLLDNINSAGSNGGGAEFLRVELVDSTVSGNDASATGAFFAQRAAIDSSTIHNNTADFAPGGVFLLERSGFRNSIITANLVTGTPDNCESNSLAIWSGGHNISDTLVGDCELGGATDRNSTNPQIGALAANGGLSRSHLPVLSGNAMDTGDPLACPTIDQRGSPRPVDGDGNASVVCDVGAIELPEPEFAAGLFAGCALIASLSRGRGLRRRARSRA